jgi:7,8-dihydropterin-6-yl-methyl-4-(beta-D-ribofuranosyl)aminobenzene 5'-phosphate synthase
MTARLTVLYDNRLAPGASTSLRCGWGFSCLVEEAGGRVLFDAGFDGGLLLHNMAELGVEPRSVDAVVLSHPHWEHLGGLARFLEARGDVPLYVPEGIPRHLRIELSNRADVTVTGTEEGSKVVPGVRTTPALGGDLKEQALVVDAGSGVLAVTGCCHPGFAPVLDAASLHGRVRGMLGGMHEAKDPEQLSGLSLVAPCHCTREPDRFPELFPRTFRQVGVGSVVNVEQAP